MSEAARFIFTKDNVNNNKVNFALSLLKGLNFDVNLLVTYKQDYRFSLKTKRFYIICYFGALADIEYTSTSSDVFIDILFDFKDLFDIFTDPTNPTPEELTLFNLEYGVPWITELRPEDLV